MVVSASAGFISKLAGGLKITGIKKLSARFAAVVLEFAVQLGTAAGITISDMIDMQLVEFFYNNTEDLQSVLNESSASLLEYIRRNYPEF
jgi:hypothetical protein